MINGLDDHIILQKDIDELMSWIKIWLKEFNIEKCKCLHTVMKNDTEETDLCVVINEDLKSSKLVMEARNKAIRAWGYIT